MNNNSYFNDFNQEQYCSQTDLKDFINANTSEIVANFFERNIFLFLASIFITIIILIKSYRNRVVRNIYSNRVNETSTTRQRSKIRPTVINLFIFCFTKFINYYLYGYKEIVNIYEKTNYLSIIYNFLFYSIIVLFILGIIFIPKNIKDYLNNNLNISLLLIFANNYNYRNIFYFYNLFGVNLNNYNFYFFILLYLIAKLFFHFFSLIFAIIITIIYDFLYIILKEHDVVLIVLEDYCDKYLKTANIFERFALYPFYLFILNFNRLYSDNFNNYDNNEIIIIEV